MIKNLTEGQVFEIKEYDQEWEVKALWLDDDEKVLVTFQITEGPGKNSQFIQEQDKFLEYINQ